MKGWAGPLRANRAPDTAGYAAFISYSHTADGRLAPAVQLGLERLVKPWYRRRALRVFRDDSGLAVTPALWRAIAAALDKSQYLVLLASPEAARSEWVGREVEHWKAANPVERILLVVTEGECHWDVARGDFDPDQSTAIPPSLLGVFVEEPRWLDLRWAREETQLDLRHSRFRDAIAQLAAPAHGREKDDLEAEDIHLHRRALHLAWSAVAILLVLAIVASVGWTNAVSNARLADREASIARARELAAQASARPDEQPLSMLLSIESLRIAPTNEALMTLLQALLKPRHNTILSLPGVGGGTVFSPDSKAIVSASNDICSPPAFMQMCVRRWDAATGQPIGQLVKLPVSNASLVREVTFSSDGTRVASGDFLGKIQFWDAATGRPIGQPLTGHTSWVESMAFSPDGRMVASAGFDGTVRRWDSANATPIGEPMTGHSFSGYSSPVKGVAFSPDGRMIASAGFDGTVRRWDAVTGQSIGQPIYHPHSLEHLAFSPDGEIIASAAGDGAVRRWYAATGQPLGQPLIGHTGPVSWVAFSPDGKTIASAGDDHTVRLWDAYAGTFFGEVVPGQPLVGHTRPVREVAFSPDGKVIAAISDDKTVRLWETSIGKPIGQPLSGHSGAVMDVAFSPDGKVIASASDDHTIRLWDRTSGKPIGKPVSGHNGGVKGMAFSPDGKTLAFVSIGVWLWDIASGKPIGKPMDPIDGHSGAIMDVAFSPDGKVIASAGFDRTVRLWNAAFGFGRPIGQPLGQPLTGHTGPVRGVAFSPDGKMIATASEDETVRRWEATSGQPVGQPLTGHTGSVEGVAFSPDGKTIVSTGEDATVRMWDARTGQPLGQPLTGHTNSVQGVAFSPDGNTLASASADRTVRLWPSSMDAWIPHACMLAERNLTQEEWDQFMPGRPYVRTCPDLPAGYGASPDAPRATYDHLDWP